MCFYNLNAPGDAPISIRFSAFPTFDAITPPIKYIIPFMESQQKALSSLAPPTTQIQQYKPVVH